MKSDEAQIYSVNTNQAIRNLKFARNLGKITSYDASTCKLTVTDADGSFSENKTICIKSHEMSMNHNITVLTKL